MQILNKLGEIIFEIEGKINNLWENIYGTKDK
jgi:hypothetical protein